MCQHDKCIFAVIDDPNNWNEFRDCRCRRSTIVRRKLNNISSRVDAMKARMYRFNSSYFYPVSPLPPNRMSAGCTQQCNPSAKWTFSYNSRLPKGTEKHDDKLSEYKACATVVSIFCAMCWQQTLFLTTSAVHSYRTPDIHNTNPKMCTIPGLNDLM